MRLNIGRLRPVGEVVRRPTATPHALPWPSTYQPYWFPSGTAALAIAIRLASRRRPLSKPAVLLPAYACPDIVSAAQWAGVEPRLVDNQPESPWLSHERIHEALIGSVVAIVAPHFLGVRQSLQGLRDTIDDRDVVLIEDSAQLGPNSRAFSPEADLVVLSFGRGKPIPVGGGVFLARNNWISLLEDELSRLCVVCQSRWHWNAKRVLQNVAMSRLGYQVALNMPFLHVGKTRFKRLTTVQRLDGDAVTLSESAIASWHLQATRTQKEICRWPQTPRW